MVIDRSPLTGPNREKPRRKGELVVRGEREREEVVGRGNKPWEDLLAVTKMGSRKVHGPLRRTSSWCLIFKNMVQEIGDQFLSTLVSATTY